MLMTMTMTMIIWWGYGPGCMWPLFDPKKTENSHRAISNQKNSTETKKTYLIFSGTVPLRMKIMIIIMTIRTVMVMMMKMLTQIWPKNFDQLSATHPDDTGGLWREVQCQQSECLFANYKNFLMSSTEYLLIIINGEFHPIVILHWWVCFTTLWCYDSTYWLLTRVFGFRIYGQHFQLAKRASFDLLTSTS